MNIYQDTLQSTADGQHKPPNPPNRNKLDWLLLPLEKQLKIDAKSKSFLQLLVQYWEILEFKLGDLIDNLTSTNSTEFFYLICQGRVRLLSLDPELQREVPTGLLTEGNTFGGEPLFDRQYLSYRAIAAESKVQVAKIPLDKLQLESISPQLQEHWRRETQNRQGLIFFKTLTALRSLSSHKLQQLLPYLEERQIVAGTTLTEANLDRFWLCRGEIGDRSVDIGSAWGYPDVLADDWVAQTNLKVYHLPQQHWETVCRLVPPFADIYTDGGERADAGEGETKTIVFTPRDHSNPCD